MKLKSWHLSGDCLFAPKVGYSVEGLAEWQLISQTELVDAYDCSFVDECRTENLYYLEEITYS